MEKRVGKIQHLFIGLFAIAVVVSIAFLDFADLSFANNKWQYATVMFPLIGIIALIVSKYLGELSRYHLSLILLVIFSIIVTFGVVCKLFFREYIDPSILMIIAGVLGGVAMIMTMKSVKKQGKTHHNT